MNCIAHLAIKDGERIEQYLEEHCSQVAKYAGESLKNIGFYNVAYLSGALHDMGKATQSFDEYIEKAFRGENPTKGSVIHSYTGVVYILEKYHNEGSYEKLTSEIIGYAIGAHHGLFDCIDLYGCNGFDKRLMKDKSEICYEEAVDNFFSGVLAEKEIEEYFRKAVDEIKSFCDRCVKSISVEKKEKNQVMDFQIGFLARLVTSAVIYGDRRDTREFMQGSVENVQDFSVEKNKWMEITEPFEKKIKLFSAKTELNKVRHKISNQCFDFAKRETGIYRLNVPTGAGKTLSTLRYALEHAKVYGKKRIIFIIPLLSVIDQNAKVFHEYLGNSGNILEHHSNVIRERTEADEKENEYNDGYLQEDWNGYPIIISTLVQLLEILFAHKTSTISRLQALSDSVIVFDEIQSLPKKTTEMFNVAMNFLKTHCNTTIILSSATQPCLETVEWPIELADNPDMVKLSESELEVFNRAEIIDKITPYGMSDDELEEFCEELIRDTSSLLVICNTKKEARDLFCRLNDKGNENCEVFHLSTAMCQAHRVNVLVDIQRKLDTVQKKPQESKKIICVATQMVEAGIDFSFQCVVRLLAGLDNLTQAAGRCNRSNEYLEKGKVYFVRLQNEYLSKLTEIKVAQESAAEVLQKKDLLYKENIIGEQAINSFYKGVFATLRKEIKYPMPDDTKYSLSRLLGNQLKENASYYMTQPFKTVASKFKVFDDETVDVIVPYGNGIDIIQRLQSIDNYREEIGELKEIIKAAKPYTISVYNHQLKKLSEYGWLEEFFEGKILVLSEEMYSEKYGLKQMVQQSVENYIF
ncbi:MAG: CRISPR-associated helicase Cas3' [Lachnospiraceae bacterium]|nr:CRISPR-associated helicase Cas3' [Lachnospiraceae bacterium]